MAPSVEGLGAYLGLELRSPKVYGSSSSSYYSGSAYHYYWPIWAYVVIGVVWLISMLWWGSLIYYSCAERKYMRQGQRYRLGHVLWKATKVALFLWICTCCCKRNKTKKYAQIGQGDGGALNNGNAWYGSAPAAAAAAPAAPAAPAAAAATTAYGPAAPYTSAPAQSPAPQNYGDGGAGYRPPEKFEPMGYAGAAGLGVHLNAPPPPYAAPSASSAVVSPPPPQQYQPQQQQEQYQQQQYQQPQQQQQQAGAAASYFAPAPAYPQATSQVVQQQQQQPQQQSVVYGQQQPAAYAPVQAGASTAYAPPSYGQY